MLSSTGTRKKRKSKVNNAELELCLTNGLCLDGGVYTVLQSTGSSVQHATAEFATGRPATVSATTSVGRTSASASASGSCCSPPPERSVGAGAHRQEPGDAQGALEPRRIALFRSAYPSAR